MTATGYVLLSYALLTAFWVLLLTAIRTYLILVRGRAANSFAADAQGEVPVLKRLTRVHANYYESAPVFLTPLLVALFTGQTQITDPLAGYLIAFRLIQSLIHLTSVSELAIKVRYGFFLAQIAIVCYWAIQLLN